VYTADICLQDADERCCLCVYLNVITCVFTAVLDTSNRTRQSSVFNEHTSELAVDDDVNTCSVTGFETGSWWVVDLGQSVKVAGIQVVGEPLQYFTNTNGL